MNAAAKYALSKTQGSLEYSNECLAPQATNDSLNFSELQGSYNFRNISDRRRVFVRQIVDDLRSRIKPTVLDIGCGCGMARENSWQWAIKPHASNYWGIEPDPSTSPEAGLFDHSQHALLENAELEDESIDVAYSWMVMEHVEDPEAFCSRLYRALKPGGTYYFSTPNIRHYFTFTARFLKKMNVDEWVLAMIRKQDLDEYHYPVQYRFNSESQVNDIAKRTGFQSAEFAYIEVEGPVKYFPGPTKLLFHALAWKRAVIQQPNCLLTMFGKLTKPV